MLKNGEPKKHVRGSKKRVEVKKTAGEVKKTVGPLRSHVSLKSLVKILAQTTLLSNRGM